MHRCIELAEQGMGNVAPNPMVGAVLVHEEKIIGEGFHQLYGKSHAEVNCIHSVKNENENLISGIHVICFAWNPVRTMVKLRRALI